jgi:GTPase SAR1 family protein
VVIAMGIAEGMAAKEQQEVRKGSEFASIIDVMKRDRYRPMKILLQGEAKSGKTQFMLSVFKWLEAEGYKPEQCKMFLLDCDDGTLPLIDKGIVKPEWLNSLVYGKCNNMDDIIKLTNEALPLLKVWQQEHGIATAWLCVDNMQFAWEWTREKFALDVYGELEHERALKKRIEAQSKGKQMAPTFNQVTDYAVINPIHNHWAEGIKISGVNFIWATPEKAFTKREKDKEPQEIIYAAGQSSNDLRVDHIIRLHTIEEKIEDPKSAEDGKVVTVFLADLLGSRSATKYFRNARPEGGFDFRAFTKWLAAHNKI